MMACDLCWIEGKLSKAERNAWVSTNAGVTLKKIDVCMHHFNGLELIGWKVGNL